MEVTAKWKNYFIVTRWGEIYEEFRAGKWKILAALEDSRSGRRKKIWSSVKGKVQDKAGKEEWLGGKTEQKEKEQRRDVLEKGG